VRKGLRGLQENARKTAAENKATGRKLGIAAYIPTEEQKRHASEKAKQLIVDGVVSREELIERRFAGWEKALADGNPDVGTHRGKHGVYYSYKMDKNFRYDSSWELVRMETLDADDNVKAYWRVPLKLPYIVKGKKKKYFVDFKVEHVDGSIAFEEIKPRPLFIYYNNLYKLGVLRKFCKNLGYECRILTSLEMCFVKTASSIA
jgi:hypothetical protein